MAWHGMGYGVLAWVEIGGVITWGLGLDEDRDYRVVVGMMLRNEET
jgi:hypothetical protein